LFEVKVVTQGVSLWYFHVYMYYNPNWFVSPIFLHSTLVPFLWWLQTVYDCYILSCIESLSTIFIILTSFYFTTFIYDLFLVWPVFHNIAVFILGLYSTFEKEHAAFGLLSLANFT
jgi:hypothetical protein